ncbi:hypothetical protein QCA50_020033 [Cerrena zonata]|uniref:F-box domain-containing protein n=1 Tax=Cerrena zonata TaxID=2478898 RepID=A0AAW0FFV8_9APHY
MALRPAYLLYLPDDVLLDAMITFEPSSTLSIRQTCKRLLMISQSKQLWVKLYFREIVQRNLPYASYWETLENIDAARLEGLVLHTLRLEQRMASSRTPIHIPMNQKRSITWIRLVHSEWLLVASSDAICSVIILWSVPDLLLSQENAAPLAEAFLPAPVNSGVIDVQEGGVVMALELRGKIDQIDILSIVDHDGALRICRLRTLDNVGHPRFIKGGLIGVSLINNINTIRIIGWADNSMKCLRYYPDEQGGAVAMYLDDEWIGVVRRQVLEIYIPYGHNYTCWRAFKLPHDVGTASFSPCTRSFLSCRSSDPLRLCISCNEGLFVYEIACDPKNGMSSVQLLWHYLPPPVPSADFYPVPSKASLGVRGTTVSWIHGHVNEYDKPVSFAHTRVVPGETEPPVFTMYDEDMPALDSLGLYDFDDARGVLVLGNAFGELSLFDFSGTDPGLFRNCLAPGIGAGSYTGQDLLPTNEITSYPGPPFPYMERLESAKTDTFEFWDRHRPKEIPDGWTADLRATNKDIPWYTTCSGVILTPYRFSWISENAGHFYGRPIPLLYREDSVNIYAEWIISDIGGLLFVWCRELDENYMIAKPGVTLQQLADSITAQGSILAKRVKYDWSQCVVGFRFMKSMRCEWETHGRHRGKELLQRGGRVSDFVLEYRA